MRLFTPRWDHWDSDKAIPAIRKIKNQKTLKKIIDETYSDERRAAAVENVTDMDLLRTLACGSSGNRKSAEAAFFKLREEADFLFVALHGDHCALRALEKLPKPRPDAHLAAEAKSLNVRAEALKEVSDPEILAIVAKNDSSRWMREIALKRITAPEVIACVAQKDEDPKLRAQALERLTDVQIIETVARTDADAENRRAALGKITNQSVLETIVRTDADDTVRMAAVERIADQALLESIARSDESGAVRLRAAEKLQNDDVRNAILLTDTDDENRLSAVKKLSDTDERLFDIAINDTAFNVHKAALEKISDTNALLQLLRKRSQYPMADYIIHKLDRDGLLSVIFSSAYGTGENASIAYERLLKKHEPDAELLSRIAACGATDKVRDLAKKKCKEIAFRPRLSESERGQKLLAALDGGSANAADIIMGVIPHDEDTIDTLLYLMEERGTENSIHGSKDPTGVGYGIFRAMKELYQKEPQLRKAMKERDLRSYDVAHFDYGSPSCHEDHAAIRFDFQ